MSWISDVRDEVEGLDTSLGNLRKFGLVVGGVFLLLAVVFFLRGKHPHAAYVFGPAGLLLFLGGAVAPRVLKSIYRGWMAFAFAIGWVVSRVLLTLLFYLVLMPVGLFARLVKKEFMDIDCKKKKDSYWVKKECSRKPNYEKMY